MNWCLAISKSRGENGPNLFFNGRIFSGIEVQVFRPMMTEERFDPSPVVILEANNHLRRRNKEELPSLDPSEHMKLYTPKAAPLSSFYWKIRSVAPPRGTLVSDPLLIE